MSLMRLRPFNRPVMRNDFDKFFSDFFSGGFADDEKKIAWSPSADIENLEDKFIVSADLPGMKLEDIKVSVEKDVLSISGERETVKEGLFENYSKLERSCGKFSRTFILPSNVDADAIEAKYKDGVLSVEIPKKEVEAPLKIEIKGE